MGFQEIKESLQRKEAQGMGSLGLDLGADPAADSADADPDAQVAEAATAFVAGQDEYVTAEIKVLDTEVEADDEDEEGEDDEEQGLLEGGSSSDDEEESEEEESDALADILDMLGLGAIAEDAKWLNMTLHNEKKKRLEPRGKIAVAISIVPWKEVEERPVGAAQDSPNANPFLPPPVGRMTFSLNPIA